MKNSFLKSFSIFIPNFPGFIPVPGAIINFWILFLILKAKLQRSTVLSLIFLCILSLVYGLIFQDFSVKYLIILCLPVLLLMCVDQSLEIYLKVLKFIFLLLIALGICSLLGINFLDVGIKFFFGYSSGLSGAGGGIRGVGLLYPEPSHAAPLLILIFHYILTNDKRFCGGTRPIILFISVFFLFYICRSGSLSLYLLVYMICFFIFLKKSFLKKLSMLVSAVAIVFVGYVMFPDSRFFQVFETAVGLVVNGSISIEKTALIASGRFIANYVWIISGLKNYFGSGLSFSVQEFIVHSRNLGVNYEVIGAFQRRGLEGLPVLPRSWLAVVVGAFGFIGIFITAAVFYLFETERKKNKIQVGASQKPLLCFALFYILVVGFPGNPIPWLIILLCGYTTGSSRINGAKIS